MTRIILGRLFFAVIDGYFLIAFKAVASFIINIPKFILDREPLSQEVQKVYNYGDYAGGFFFDTTRRNKFNQIFKPIRSFIKIRCI